MSEYQKPRHIYWFAYYNPDSPSTRYRGQYLLRELEEKKGISHDFVYPGYRPRNVLHFIRVYLLVLLFPRRGSIIVFQKIYTRRIYATLLKVLLYFRGNRSYYDIDDAEYLRQPPETVHHFMRRCVAVFAGSEAIRDYALKFNPKVHLLTSPVIAHPFRRGERNGMLTLGWVGFYNAHKASMEALVYPALEQLDFPVRLVLMGVNRPAQRAELRARFAQVPHVDLEIVEGIDWLDEASVYRRIATFDFGLAPLLDTPLNRAKSAFKVKQYLSCGVPVIGSPVGENAKFIVEGVNGFKCGDASAFQSRLSNCVEFDIISPAKIAHGRLNGTFSYADVTDSFLAALTDGTKVGVLEVG